MSEPKYEYHLIRQSAKAVDNRDDDCDDFGSYLVEEHVLSTYTDRELAESVFASMIPYDRQRSFLIRRVPVGLSAKEISYNLAVRHPIVYPEEKKMENCDSCGGYVLSAKHPDDRGCGVCTIEDCDSVVCTSCSTSDDNRFGRCDECRKALKRDWDSALVSSWCKRTNNHPPSDMKKTVVPQTETKKTVATRTDIMKSFQPKVEVDVSLLESEEEEEEDLKPQSSASKPVTKKRKLNSALK